MVVTHLFSSTKNLGNINAGPEEFQMLAHFLRFVLGVKDGQFGKHSHVGTFKSKSSFQQVDELLEIAAVLVVVNQVF